MSTCKVESGRSNTLNQTRIDLEPALRLNSLCASQGVNSFIDGLRLIGDALVGPSAGLVQAAGERVIDALEEAGIGFNHAAARGATEMPEEAGTGGAA